MARMPGRKKDVLISRTLLSEMDLNESIKRIAPGSLPHWCRQWCRDRLPSRLSLLNVDALPMLYTQHGERLPRGVAIGLLRALSNKKSAEQAIGLFADYVHPVALARLSDHVLAQWYGVMSRDAVTHVEQAQYSWVPRIHAHFGDLYGLERAMNEAVFPTMITERQIFSSTGYWNRVQRHGLDEHTLPHLFAALRDGIAPGAALLVLMAHAEEVDDFFWGVLSQALCRDPHFKRVRHVDLWWSAIDDRHRMQALSIDYMARLVDDLGFAEQGRAYLGGDGTSWLGAEIFERFVGREEDDDSAKALALNHISINSFQVAVWVFSQLFTQTGTALEHAAAQRTTWTREVWESLFLDRRYFAFWAQRVLWARHAGEAGPEPFRVCEDLSLADEADEALTLGDEDMIRVLESASLSTRERSRWAELLASYEVITAFEQF